MTNILVPKLFVVFAFSAPPFSVGETLHVAYKSMIKRKFTFFSENTKFISSRELKTSEFTLVLRTRENSDIFNTLDEIRIWHSPKKVNVLYLLLFVVCCSAVVCGILCMVILLWCVYWCPI